MLLMFARPHSKYCIRMAGMPDGKDTGRGHRQDHHLGWQRDHPSGGAGRPEESGRLRAQDGLHDGDAIGGTGGFLGRAEGEVVRLL